MQLRKVDVMVVLVGGCGVVWYRESTVRHDRKSIGMGEGGEGIGWNRSQDLCGGPFRASLLLWHSPNSDGA